jgi:hypothetical protein
MSVPMWRNRSPLRPIVFSDDGQLDGEVVHLHLEHRLVQRLLGRFAAQGLVQFDLARACVGHADDSQPRVVLIGRLGLYGPRAGRLHDELIAVAARWRPADVRKGPLEPFAEGGAGETKTLDLLDRALPDADQRPVPEEVTRRLLDTLPQDVADLRPHLEVRAAEVVRDAKRRLWDRGAREAAELERLIRERRDRILAAQALSPQFELTLESTEDRRQFQAERRYWEKRLIALETELVGEPARVRESYDVRSARVEPVGIVYLWPVSG